LDLVEIAVFVEYDSLHVCSHLEQTVIRLRFIPRNRSKGSVIPDFVEIVFVEVKRVGVAEDLLVVGGL
jgi:hypothetical protein